MYAEDVYKNMEVTSTELTLEFMEWLEKDDVKFKLQTNTPTKPAIIVNNNANTKVVTQNNFQQRVDKEKDNQPAQQQAHQNQRIIHPQQNNQSQPQSSHQ